jgi:MFS transporter, NNP family, nitrate/nitrite transporter
LFTAFRFFVGFIGATFVTTQLWTSIVYAVNVVTTANATAAGRGNPGGGFTNVLMQHTVNCLGTTHALLPHRACVADQPSCRSPAHRQCNIFLTDDDPEGQYKGLHRKGTKTKTNAFIGMLRAAKNHRVWILFLGDAGFFGFEPFKNGNLTICIQNEFPVNKGKAWLITGLFDLMNLFAPSLVGILSDLMNKRFVTCGRLWTCFIVLFLDSVLALIVFSRMKVLSAVIPVVLIFPALRRCLRA